MSILSRWWKAFQQFVVGGITKEEGVIPLVFQKHEGVKKGGEHRDAKGFEEDVYAHHRFDRAGCPMTDVKSVKTVKEQ